MEAIFGKKYKLDSSDNFEAFMKELGVPFLTRKAGNLAAPVVDLTKSGDEYTLTSNSTFKNVATKFKTDVEMEQDTPDGRKVKSLFTINGNTISETQTDPIKKLTATIDRTFTADEVKMVMKVGDVSATRIYKVCE